jgi:hypothetical protein
MTSEGTAHQETGRTTEAWPVFCKLGHMDVRTLKESLIKSYVLQVRFLRSDKQVLSSDKQFPRSDKQFPRSD